MKYWDGTLENIRISETNFILNPERIHLDINGFDSYRINILKNNKYNRRKIVIASISIETNDIEILGNDKYIVDILKITYCNGVPLILAVMELYRLGTLMISNSEYNDTYIKLYKDSLRFLIQRIKEKSKV